MPLTCATLYVDGVRGYSVRDTCAVTLRSVLSGAGWA